MINTILIDLDGTVLPMDNDLFIKLYFGEMSKAFHDIEDSKRLVQNVWKSTDAMVRNNGQKTNEEVFMETYGQLIDGDLEIHKSRFDAFYEEGFLKVQPSTKENKIMKDSIRILKEKGYQVVLATNPIFPLRANEHRIRWAGLLPEDFSYISHFEKNHYCKPNLKYYEEVLSEIGKTPQECMMVGNDVQEDMIVKQLGMTTFLLEDHIIHRVDEAIIVDYRGNYEAFHKFVTELPELK